MMENQGGGGETLHEIAVQDMPHLALAPDLMTVIGAAPAYGRHFLPSGLTRAPPASTTAHPEQPSSPADQR